MTVHTQTCVYERARATLQAASGLIYGIESGLLSRAQFVPNTTRNGGPPGFVRVTAFLAGKQKQLVSVSSV
jgi:hypothetical protein